MTEPSLQTVHSWVRLLPDVATPAYADGVGYLSIQVFGLHTLLIEAYIEAHMSGHGQDAPMERLSLRSVPATWRLAVAPQAASGATAPLIHQMLPLSLGDSPSPVAPMVDLYLPIPSHPGAGPSVDLTSAPAILELLHQGIQHTLSTEAQTTMGAVRVLMAHLADRGGHQSASMHMLHHMSGVPTAWMDTVAPFLHTVATGSDWQTSWIAPAMDHRIPNPMYAPYRAHATSSAHAKCAMMRDSDALQTAAIDACMVLGFDAEGLGIASAMDPQRYAFHD